MPTRPPITVTTGSSAFRSAWPDDPAFREALGARRPHVVRRPAPRASRAHQPRGERELTGRQHEGGQRQVVATSAKWAKPVEDPARVGHPLHGKEPVPMASVSMAICASQNEGAA